MYICWLFFYNICFVHCNSYMFVVVNFYMIYFVYRKIWWRSEERVGGASHIAPFYFSNFLEFLYEKYQKLELPF